MKQRRYGSLDGLRTIACIGIAMMHMKANNNYDVQPLCGRVIDSFTDFTFLFMMLSAFGMCCGYHTRMLKGEISLSEFYKKRYLKILPFFSFLVLIDLLMDKKIESLYEAIANISLTHGLFPNNIGVIGVGWFLGLVFAFYLMFPFYCVIVETKKRAWISLFISLVLNYIGGMYFDLERNNIVYSSCFFIAGGILYLYRDKIEKIKWYFSFPLLVLSIVGYFLIGSYTLICLVVSAMFIVYAIGAGNGLENRFTTFISGISLEVYLSHMVVFRGIEKLHLNTIWGDGSLQYIITVVIVLISAILFSVVVKKMLEKIEAIIKKIIVHI